MSNKKTILSIGILVATIMLLFAVTVIQSLIFDYVALALGFAAIFGVFITPMWGVDSESR